MSFEPSTMNNVQFPYAADTHLAPPPSPVYNNPNGIGFNGGADSGESNYALATIDVGGGDVVKRKRGRPRKNPADGSESPAVMTAAQSGDFLSPAASLWKRARGRPSIIKQQPAASGSPRAAFMPHVVDVQSGEDVLAKLVSFSQNSKNALCILSASGAISNVTLEQIATSGGTVTYEGRFEILSLSGTFRLPESKDQRSSICGLTVALSGPDGCVLGGNVAGLLTAASPVQVIVGSFVPASRKQSKESGGSEVEVVNGPANQMSESLSESLDGFLGSPAGQSTNSDPQGIVDMLWR